MLTSIHLAVIVASIIISASVPVGGGTAVGADHNLPTTSADFFSSHSCSRDEVLKSLDINTDDDSFYRWVLSARHTTWQPGWEVGIPLYNNTIRVDDLGGEKYYARVFDLLNWSRKQNALPLPVNISSICHKGMETQYNNLSPNNNNIPMKPSEFIPTEMWSNVWNTCRKQLISSTRISSSYIDIPGILVTNPYPPWKVNNPCSFEYRMVDGAHRICLRKYLLLLLTGELNELTDLTKESSGETSVDSIKDQIRQKEYLIKQTSIGHFLVLNQSTFESMLTNSDPHTTWAKSQELLMQDVTTEMKVDWKKWMERVMDRALEEKSGMIFKDEL